MQYPMGFVTPVDGSNTIKLLDESVASPSSSFVAQRAISPSNPPTIVFPFAFVINFTSVSVFV